MIMVAVMAVVWLWLLVVCIAVAWGDRVWPGRELMRLLIASVLLVAFVQVFG